MRVVTSGSAYLDIDAYACCIAYAELLNGLGVAARAVSSAPPNASVCATVLGWEAGLDDYRPQADDAFVLVDVSDPHHVDPWVALERVEEVIDHHPGHETYWAGRLGPAADIRPVGAAATQVFERWEASGLLSRIRPSSAALLATAILDNTLNLTGQMTTALDVRAYDVLARQAGLPADWPERYFLECQAAIERELCASLEKDLKRMKPDSGLPALFAQMTVWDAGALVARHRAEISGWLTGQGEDWLLNVIGIREGESRFLADPPISQDKVSRLVALDWHAGQAVLQPSILRKELLRLGLSAKCRVSCHKPRG
ncbi:DHH family protein [Pseudomonas sp. COR58]|uniref:DHH family protein n=1 Tax=Pseudomonas ekonensis TaxID=2842353 RepID=A0ABS6PBR7_9PSED|nr:DHH family protein [Pseudomonas ekonensis]MBV4457904.1 DHH family protein [Pseudomonas ekonensis]